MSSLEERAALAEAVRELLDVVVRSDAGAEGTVEGTVTLQPIHEGPPGSVHGGISALLLDQLLGHAIAAADQPGMTVELTVRYRKPTPYGVPLTLRARRTTSTGRLVEATGEILADGVAVVEAHGRFLCLAAEQRARMLAAMGD